MNTINVETNSQPGGFSLEAPGVSLRLRQVASIVGIELKKTLLSKRVLPVFALALLPIFITIIGVTIDLDDSRSHIDEARQRYAYIYSSLILGAVVFLGSAIIFTTLFRGEILNQSIHYYMLAPVRREILVAAKFLAGFLSAFGLFGTTTVVCYLLFYLPFGMTRFMVDVSSGIALTQLSTYLGITLLGCVGYGSLFMLSGLLFRNPLIPVAGLAGWELIHFVLPPALKLFSVIHYLKGLLPIPMELGPLAVIMAPVSIWESILGILFLAAVALIGTCMILRRLEVKYSEE